MKLPFIQFGNNLDDEIYLIREDTIVSIIVSGSGKGCYTIEAETPIRAYPLFEGTLKETVEKYKTLCKELKITATKVYL